MTTLVTVMAMVLNSPDISFSALMSVVGTRRALAVQTLMNDNMTTVDVLDMLAAD